MGERWMRCSAGRYRELRRSMRRIPEGAEAAKLKLKMIVQRSGFRVQENAGAILPEPRTLNPEP
jgi:hypothetical protein